MTRWELVSASIDAGNDTTRKIADDTKLLMESVGATLYRAHKRGQVTRVAMRKKSSPVPYFVYTRTKDDRR
jgi:hypothetical protein